MPRAGTVSGGGGYSIGPLQGTVHEKQIFTVESAGLRIPNIKVSCEMATYEGCYLNKNLIICHACCLMYITYALIAYIKTRFTRFYVNSLFKQRV